ncbi:MAG: putative zinc-binding metallopeptidase [Acidimicrobiales bacterium]
MQPFHCDACDQLLFFDNSTCLYCGSPLGYDPTALRLRTLRTDAGDLVAIEPGDGCERWRRCANVSVARCNWLVPTTDPGILCRSCRLTTVRPNDGEADALIAFADAEAAKRRLLHQLLSLGLPVVSQLDDAKRGVAFELLSSRGQNVITGHEDGRITLDLSESDGAHREFVRQQLGEAYRTVLGHLRHEIGHYYWPQLVVDVGRLTEFRDLFGDERVSYEEAKAGHYGADDGDDASWADGHVSRYATMHPWEDWAETFAHYLHIDDGVDTARTFGVTVGQPSSSAGRAATPGSSALAVASIVADWLGLTVALNGLSRSIGEGDLYPFVLSQRVIEKLDFVHRCLPRRNRG